MRYAPVIAILLVLGCNDSKRPFVPIVVAPATIAIGTVTAEPGDTVEVPISLILNDAHEAPIGDCGDIDVLVQYTDSLVSFVGARQGEAISTWEFFTARSFRRGHEEVPESNEVRLVMIRDYNNGITPDPPMLRPNGPLGYLRFAVSNNDTHVGLCAQITFALHTCGDNVITNRDVRDTMFTPDLRVGTVDVGPEYTQDSCYLGGERYWPMAPVLELTSGSVCIVAPAHAVHRESP